MPEPAPAWWKIADAAAAKEEKALQRALSSTLDLQPKSEAALARTLTGRVTLGKVDAAFDFAAFQSELEEEMLKRTVRSAQEAAISTALRLDSEIDVEDYLRVARQRAKSTARLMTQQTRQAVRDAIARMQREGYSQREIRENIRHLAGLNRQQANAVLNQANRLREAGRSQAQISRRIRSLSARNRTRRARFTAQNETRQAAEDTMSKAFELAEKQGVIEEATHTWRQPAPRKEPICRRLHGQTRKLGESFIDPATGVAYAKPQAHGNCRCGRTFKFKKPRRRAA